MPTGQGGVLRSRGSARSITRASRRDSHCYIRSTRESRSRLSLSTSPVVIPSRRAATSTRQRRRQIRSAQQLEHSNNTNRTTVSITNIQNSRDPDCDYDHANATGSSTQHNTVVKTMWASQAVVTESPTVVRNCVSLPSHSPSSPRATQGVDRSNDAVESTTDANSLTTELYPPSLDPCAPPFGVGQPCTRPRAR